MWLTILLMSSFGKSRKLRLHQEGTDDDGGDILAASILRPGFIVK